ncbi:MAG: SDR family oxidoreductase [Streptosporangiales bacterium]|nr:SDR family oxidoreductase [Streptosporangiales bacterium]
MVVAGCFPRDPERPWGAYVAAIVITGGSRGIGAATARLAARRGHRVCVGYRSDDDAAAAVVAEITGAGGEAFAVRADTSTTAGVETLFTAAGERLGRLDGLVNNAGVVAPKARVDQLDEDRINHLLRTNVTGPLLCARQAVLRMSTAYGGSGGVIVNVSSAAARIGGPGEYVDYAASKGAVDTLTAGLAAEVVGEGIRVNGVRPGLIDTDIHEPGRLERVVPSVPMKRAGRAEEVAEAILWLLSDASSYVTGATLDVSGGR